MKETVNWGGKLCPDCKQKEIVWADRCNDCQIKTPERKRKQSAYMRAYNAKDSTKTAKRNYMKGYHRAKKTFQKKQAIELHIHVYIHDQTESHLWVSQETLLDTSTFD